MWNEWASKSLQSINILLSLISHQTVQMSISRFVQGSNSQKCIGSIVAELQDTYYIPQNQSSSAKSTVVIENAIEHEKPQILKMDMFRHFDTPQNQVYKFLQQNIWSLNSLSNGEKHDYSSAECEEFVHVLNLEQGEDLENCYNEVETVQSEFEESALKTNEETNSKMSESVFEFMGESEFEETVSMINSAR